MDSIPASVREFRERFRRTRIPNFYSGELHLVFILIVLGGAMAWHLSRLQAPDWMEWLMVPMTLLLGNGVEYMIHRYPLHKVYPLLRPLYEIHSINHHRFYTYEAMPFEQARDFMMVLFAPWISVLVVAGTTLVGAYGIAPLLSENAGHFFAAFGAASLLLYEIFHTLAHCSDEGWAGRLPLIQGIRRYHRIHHDLRLMSRCNFNITFPVFDWLCGTWLREARPPGPALGYTRSTHALPAAL